jgi:hypothetical protein
MSTPVRLRPETPSRDARRVRAAEREEGAAMLVVMLLLLMTTGIALFAVQTTGTEIRSAGAIRQSLQTQYVGETGLAAAITWADAVGGPGLLRVTETPSRPMGFMAAFNEPELLPTARAYRLYFRPNAPTPVNDFQSVGALGAPPIESRPGEEQSLARVALEPEFTVDANDILVYPAVIAGHRSDGLGSMSYLSVTFTSRGRTRIRGATDVQLIGDRLLYHEGASDARAQVVVGPFGGAR